MHQEQSIWLASSQGGEHYNLLYRMANRHGLISGATGTGKTTTLKVMIEGFSAAGIPCFVADVKGDVASLSQSGTDSEDMRQRIRSFGIQDWSYDHFPVQLWDIYGQSGLPVRASVSSIGPGMLARMLSLSPAQEGVLNIVFHIADDQGLLLINLQDLTAMLSYVSENRGKYSMEYGNISPSTIAAIQRTILQLRDSGGDLFFGEPELDIEDWMKTDERGYGCVNILDSAQLIQTPQLYSMFLLWMLGELFNRLPEVGDTEKPKIVFFFDEAHLLFRDTPAALESKIEQVVKLIRSKGVGVYFCTQSPSDLPDAVLAQLSNKVQHALRPYTPLDQKAVRAAADGFRTNPALDTAEAITSCKTGEAVISFLQEDGSPMIVQKGKILPPQSRFGAISDPERRQLIDSSPFYAKYARSIDSTSAYEVLTGREAEEAPEAEESSGSIQKQREQIALERERIRLEKEKADLEAKKRRNEEAARKKTRSRTEKALDAAMTSAARTTANRIVRGILGSILK